MSPLQSATNTMATMPSATTAMVRMIARRDIGRLLPVPRLGVADKRPVLEHLHVLASIMQMRSNEENFSCKRRLPCRIHDELEGRGVGWDGDFGAAAEAALVHVEPDNRGTPEVRRDGWDEFPVNRDEDIPVYRSVIHDLGGENELLVFGDFQAGFLSSVKGLVIVAGEIGPEGLDDLPAKGEIIGHPLVANGEYGLRDWSGASR